jgi:hypothetical protein
MWYSPSASLPNSCEPCQLADQPIARSRSPPGGEHRLGGQAEPAAALAAGDQRLEALGRRFGPAPLEQQQPWKARLGGEYGSSMNASSASSYRPRYW